MADKVYADGIRTFAKHEKAPDFVIGTLIITPNDLFTWLKANPQFLSDYEGKKQLRLQMTKGESGRVNISVDTYKPEPKPGPAKTAAPTDEPLPF